MVLPQTVFPTVADQAAMSAKVKNPTHSLPPIKNNQPSLLDQSTKKPRSQSYIFLKQIKQKTWLQKWLKQKNRGTSLIKVS